MYKKSSASCRLLSPCRLHRCLLLAKLVQMAILCLTGGVMMQVSVSVRWSWESWGGRKAVQAAFLQWITAAQSCLKLTYSFGNFTQGNALHIRGGVRVNSRNLVEVLTSCKMWTVFLSVVACSCVQAACLFKARHLLT